MTLTGVGKAFGAEGMGPKALGQDDAVPSGGESLIQNLSKSCMSCSDEMTK